MSIRARRTSTSRRWEIDVKSRSSCRAPFIRLVVTRIERGDDSESESEEPRRARPKEQELSHDAWRISLQSFGKGDTDVRFRENWFTSAIRPHTLQDPTTVASLLTFLIHFSLSIRLRKFIAVIFMTFTYLFIITYQRNNPLIHWKKWIMKLRGVSPGATHIRCQLYAT